MCAEPFMANMIFIFILSRAVPPPHPPYPGCTLTLILMLIVVQRLHGCRRRRCRACSFVCGKPVGSCRSEYVNTAVGNLCVSVSEGGVFGGGGGKRGASLLKDVA